MIVKNQSMVKRQNCVICKKLKSERHNVFTGEFNNISWISNDDKGIQSIDSIESYTYATSKDVVSGKLWLKCNNITKRYKND